MSNLPSFPKYPTPSLTRDNIVGYLVPYREKGWDIYLGETDNQIIIRLTDNLKLFIEFVSGRWRVSTGLAPNESIAIWAYPETILELDASLQRCVPIVSSGNADQRMEWPGLPTAVRLAQAEPASNVGKLAALIGRSTIDAVFDSYIDNKSLDTLLNLVTLGTVVSPSLRLLTSTKMTHSTSQPPRLTVSYARAWIAQLGCANCEIRHKAYTGHQRRFLLLSGGQSLLLGPSLNNLGLNEAAHLESDRSDRPFFEGEWVSATALIV